MAFISLWIQDLKHTKIDDGDHYKNLKDLYRKI